MSRASFPGLQVRCFAVHHCDKGRVPTLGLENRIRLGGFASCLPKANAGCGADAVQPAHEPIRLASHIVRRWTVEREVDDEMATGLLHKPRNSRRLNLVMLVTTILRARSVAFPLASGRVNTWKRRRRPATCEESHRCSEEPPSGPFPIGRRGGGAHFDKESIASPEVSVVPDPS